MNFHNPTGIYIHIPFCYRKCSYCNFFSIANPSFTLKTDYITCLCKEITQTVHDYRNNPVTNLNSVYFGGGTPNILSINELEKVIRCLENSFHISFPQVTETTIEINPGLVDLNYLKELRNLGFNRISLGIQSLNDPILSLMKRPHNSKEALKSLEDVIASDFINISCDIMFNYPTQSKDQVFSDLNRLLKFPITHISAYSLSLEPKTLLYKQVSQKKLTMGNEDEERETYYGINQFLKENNFKHYEISNYSKDGYESRQNNLYWSLGSYFGFGPGASSFIKNIRIDRPKDLKWYLKNQPIPKENISYLTERELKEEFMFLGLRKIDGIYNQDYNKLFNSSFFIDFKDPINRLMKKKFIEKKDTRIQLTPLGIDFADTVALEFLL